MRYFNSIIFKIIYFERSPPLQYDLVHLLANRAYSSFLLCAADSFGSLGLRAVGIWHNFHTILRAVVPGIAGVWLLAVV